MEPEPKSEFEKAGDELKHSFVGEFWQFLRYNQKWWLVPFIVAVLLMGLFWAFSSSAAAPFIYTIF